jgi:hypothetical protein
MRRSWRGGIALAAGMLLGHSGCADDGDTTITRSFDGESMLSTITDGAEVRVNGDAYSDVSPELGDLILFLKDSRLIVKRVAAVAGQTVAFRGDECRLCVDGPPLEEPYVERNREALRGCGGGVDRTSVSEDDV